MSGSMDLANQWANTPEDIRSKIIKGLSAVERAVVSLRFVYDGRDCMNIEGISGSLRINRERVKQIEGKVLAKIDKSVAQGKA